MPLLGHKTPYCIFSFHAAISAAYACGYIHPIPLRYVKLVDSLVVPRA